MSCIMRNPTKPILAEWKFPNWTSPFFVLSVVGCVFFHFRSNFNRTFCKLSLNDLPISYKMDALLILVSAFYEQQMRRPACSMVWSAHFLSAAAYIVWDLLLLNSEFQCCSFFSVAEELVWILPCQKSRMHTPKLLYVLCFVRMHGKIIHAQTQKHTTACLSHHAFANCALWDIWR